MKPCGRVAEKPVVMPECRVVNLWHDCLTDVPELETVEGEIVRVVYPGRPNGNHGADFLDAVIATERGLLKGDVEVHVSSSRWHAHKHHLDPAYNRVIMHVVYHNDTAEGIQLSDGRSVPTLSLENLVANKTTPGQKWLPCHNAVSRMSFDSLGEVLDAAGEERFLARVDGFRENTAGPGQILYEGIMTALGYTRNKLQFLKLARNIPLDELETVTSAETSDDECLAQLQARLLGAGGLLPSQRQLLSTDYENDDGWVKKLEKTWSLQGGPVALSADDWHISGIRPGNIPVRRIAAMSYLLVRYRRTGLLNGLTGALYGREAEAGCTDLGKLLVVNAAGYWAQQLDFHLTVRRIAPALLGRARAADIIVNVLLPFAYVTVSPERPLDIYHSYPRLAQNALEKHMMKQLDLDRQVVNSARRQQGLIHIYRVLCSQGKCPECPLSH
jgi:hypothetical protein